MKGITHPVTALPMAFSCGLCSRAMLPSGAAADEYLCMVSHVPADVEAFSEAAMLGVGLMTLVIKPVSSDRP